MSCLLPSHWQEWVSGAAGEDALRWLSVSGSSFALIAAAEIGDKSQLVCMTLAGRYRATPIVAGASAAFALLNLLAVLFGAALARWIPPDVLGLLVIILFTAFGLKALLASDDEDEGDGVEKSGHGIFVTTFLLIFAAEFGDKTQLAVAGLGATLPPLPIWVGATLALVGTSAAGVWAGKAFLRHLPVHWLHRLSGLFFLGFAAFAAWEWVPEHMDTLVGRILSIVQR